MCGIEVAAAGCQYMWWLSATSPSAGVTVIIAAADVSVLQAAVAGAGGTTCGMCQAAL
jgi:hypothetical protein